MTPEQAASRQSLTMLQKICRVMLALGADDHAVPVKAIHAKLIQGRFFVPEARPLAEVIRAKTWNTDRLFRSSPERGEYTLRPAGIALARTRHRAPLPPWDRCELLGEEPMHEIRTRRANAGRLNAGDFFGSPTFLEEVLNSTARPLPTMRALASADARARLRIGLASAMQKRGVSPRCCRVLFGRQAVMFLNGYHRTLGRTSFGVACRTLRVSPAVLLLEKLTTVEVRDIAAGIDFESVSTTAKSRAAIVRLQAAAERHRLHLIEMDTSR